MSGGYDEGYKACPCFWGREPGSLIQRLAEHVSTFYGRTVLDAGCGEGKNAIYLAQNGATVRAIDISELAIRNARELWPATGNVKWEVGDVRTIEFGRDMYDVVVAYGLFHCLRTNDEIRTLTEHLQNATRPGGYNIVCAFNNRSQDLRAHPDFSPCLVDHQFYISLYSKWSLLICTDSDLTESHPHNNIIHTHSMTRLLARR